MKIILIHNKYQIRGGEDIVFDNEYKLLNQHGNDIIVYEQHNNDIKTFSKQQKISMLWQTVWSWKNYNEIRSLIHKAQPELVHFHNTFPLISPSAYYACKNEGVPVVQTLHNFRFFCPSGLLLRDGHVCEKCLQHGVLSSLKYACYRDSRIETLPVAMMILFHQWRKTWIKCIDTFIALTEFARSKYIQAGLPCSKLVVKPNFLNFTPKLSNENNGYIIFIGRLTHEKGIETLIKCWKYFTHIPLKIIGDGPIRVKIEEIIKEQNIRNVEFIGEVTHTEAMNWLQGARFLIVPSVCYESFPLVICEAFAYGKPVIASRLGAMTALIEDGKTGLLFNPGDPDDLAAKVKWMLDHNNEAAQMGIAARTEFETKYTAEKNYEMLMNIYEMTKLKYLPKS